MTKNDLSCSRPRRLFGLATALSVLATGVVLPFVSSGSVAAATNPDLCYIVADTGGGNGGNDWLVEYNVATDAFTAIGTGTGTDNIEASALWPGTDTLYAIDADRLGTIDLTTGVYTALGSAFGTANGPNGPQALTDADAMAFDPFSGIIWAAERNSGSADYVFQIDPLTGAFIPNAFGPGLDYVVSTPYSAGSPDIDDFAIGAADGRLLAVANSGGTVATQLLVEIDRTNGDQTLIGPIGQADMEGLGVDVFGNFYGTDGTNERLYDIDVVTGAATNARSINIGGDYESVSCLTGDTSTISGTVFRDDDADATLDAGEPGQGGATIELVRDTDGDGVADAGEAVVAARTSAADGTYEFEIAAIGDFVVRVVPATLPPGNVTTSPTEIGVSITTVGEASTGHDFGFGPLPSLAGTVRDEIGVPIPGVTVTIDDGAGFSANSTTLADGSYSFTGLAPGTYTVTQSQPAGYSDVSTTAGSAGGVDAVQNVVSGIALSVGTAATGYDFVEGFGSIAGSVYADADADGVFDAGESGIAGAQVTLSGTDDGGNVINTTVSTNGSGDYLFDGLLSGTYTITEVTPAGYLDGDDAVGSTGGTAVNPGDEINGVTLAAGEDAVDYDFGELDDASISGSVLDDLGRPIAGVTVELSGTDDRGAITPVSTVTSADGSYSFAGLRPGTYTVTESQPAAYGDGLDSVGSAGGTLGNDVLSAIPLAAGASATGYDFTETTASIAGTVSESGGAFDGDPIAGVTVNLRDDGGAVIDTAVTLADGSYQFVGLPAGDYTVQEVQPTAYGDGPDTAGSAGGSVDDPNDEIDLTLPAGATAVGYAFTEVRGSISGHVFVDADDDGVYDDGLDAPLAGVDVTLTGTDATGAVGPVVVSTSADGSYTFGDLLAGTYTVTEGATPGYADGNDSVGSAGGTLGNDVVSAIPLAGGVDAVDYDFGERPSAGIDGNVSARRDDGALAPLEGVTVQLTGADVLGYAVSLTETTDASGDYSFGGLLPGTYTVTEVQPAGYGQDSTVAGTAGGAVAGDVISAIVIAGTEVATGYDFIEDYGSIAGTVYDDLNNNGVQDAGEPGLGGVDVTLSGTDVSGVVAPVTIQSQPDGSYVFVDLLAGTYTVDETTPVGYLDGTDADGSTGGAATNPGDSIDGITLAADEDATDHDFGEIRPGSVSGSVLDEHGAPIVGVSVELSGTDDRGAITAVSTVTSADGSYSFGDLRPGTYTVTETQPAGFGEGGESSDDVGASLSTNVIAGLSLAVGGSNGNNDFVETYSSIGGHVFVDVDDDGVRDADEPGLPGVTVRLNGTDPTGAIAEIVATTAADGSYLFDDLLAGTYTITEETPAAFSDGDDSAGSVGGTAVNPGDEINAIALPADIDAVDYDFGEVGTIVAGTVWIDDDRDGSIGSDEELRLDGVTVVLETPAGNEIARTTTAADGSYIFIGLAAGDYVVVQEQPDGHGSTTPNRLELTVPTGGVTDADFGEDLGSIGDVVFDDVDGDGVQDPSETGVAGVEIELRDDSSAVVATTTSAADGSYLFDRLAPGAYTVAFDPPAGRSLTLAGQGTTDTDSDPDWVTGVTADIEIGVDATSGLVDRRDDVDAGVVETVIDLAVTVEPDTTSAQVGEQVTFSFDPVNLSEVPVIDGAEVIIQLPPAVTLDRVDAPGWDVEVSGSILTLRRAGTLLPGDSLPPISVVTTVASGTASTALNVTIGTINAESETTLVNNDDAAAFTVPVPTATPTSTSTPTPSTPSLPSTGSDTRTTIRIAVGLLAAGVVLHLAGGRRRRTVTG